MQDMPRRLCYYDAVELRCVLRDKICVSTLYLRLFFGTKLYEAGKE